MHAFNNSKMKAVKIWPHTPVRPHTVTTNFRRVSKRSSYLRSLCLLLPWLAISQIVSKR